MNTLLGLSGIALAWVFYGATIVGLGALFLCRVSRKTSLSFSCCFWIGLTLLVATLQVINLFSGINLFFVRSICLLGLFSFWVFRAQLDVRFWPRLEVWKKLLVAITILWIADRALADSYVYDSGLYHFSSVKWANELPLPPGLGNLDGRLAFNQSYFLFVSFLNLLPKTGDGHNFANSLLLVFTLITILEKWGQTTRYRGNKTVLLMLGPLVVFFALLFNHTNEPGISSPSPDLATLCLQVDIFALAIAAWDRNAVQGKTQQTIEVTAILFLSGLAVTFKLSTIVFSGGIAFFAVYVCLHGSDRKGLLVTILPALLTLFVLFFTWIIRSVIASGYLIYPVVGAGLPVSWKIPGDLVRLEANWIYSWAREPGTPPEKVFADMSWFEPWSNRFATRPDTILELCLLGFAGFLLIKSFVRSPNETTNGLRRSGHFMALGSVCMAAVVFWFSSAPDPRFLGATLGLLVLSLFGIALEVSGTQKIFSLAAMGAFVVLGLGIAMAVRANGLGLVELKKRRIGSPVPVVELVEKVTNSGLRVWVPVAGDQVWNAPLPATAYFKPDLALRGKGLASGFWLRNAHTR